MRIYFLTFKICIMFRVFTDVSYSHYRFTIHNSLKVTVKREGEFKPCLIPNYYRPGTVSSLTRKRVDTCYNSTCTDLSLYFLFVCFEPLFS